MLVIVIQRFLDILEMIGQHQIRISQRIVLIKDMLREPEFMIHDHRTAEYLYHKTAAVQNQTPPLLIIKNPRLAALIVMHHLSHFHGMFRSQAIVASHQIGSCAFRPSDQTLVHIGRNPVVAVDKSNPLSLRYF